MVTGHLPVFLEPEDYSYIDSLENPEQLKKILSEDIQTLASPAGFAMKDFISRDPVGIGRPAFKKIRQLQYDDNFDLYEGHVISKDSRYMLVFINPAFPSDNTGQNSRLLKGMDQITGDLQTRGLFMQ